MIRQIGCCLVMGMSALYLAGCGDQGGPSAPTRFSLSGPHQVSKPGQPSMTYTVVTRPDGNREFIYFMIVKPPEPANGVRQQSTSFETSSNGVNGYAKSTITLNGKQLTVDYKMTVHPDGTLETESFLVDGQIQKFDKGRVFLVDLTAEPIRIVAHDVKLSTTIPDALNKFGAAEKLAQGTLQELEKDPVIAEFTRLLK